MSDADPRWYWNDPATKKVALQLIADTGNAVRTMKDAGAGADAVLDTLCGSLAYLIAMNFPPEEDEELIEQMAWALRGKVRDARQKLPGIRTMKPGNA